MRIFYSAFLVFNILFLLSAKKTAACGYAWVGDCSSFVHLRINGTLDSFIIADCPAGIRFDGLHLGTLQNLSLANAKAITWESCINNVSAVGLKYRVYEQGVSGGNFQNLNLDQEYFTLVGAYTTRYRSKASNINLAAGLTVGKTYVLEVYFLAEIDTIGDDFIPETTLIKNNDGQNYRATFTYGGPTATPFVVVPTNVQEPKCHGESNGIVGVSVWGDHTGLFYNWSNLNLNFYQQNNLSVGTYTVTVTGANYTESETIVLGQPATLAVQSTNIQPVTCGGGTGAATVLPGGGTSPYKYLWQNGQTTATANFTNSGNYTVTVTDAHDCTLMHTVQIPGGGLVQQSLSETICTGESIEIGGIVISEAGVYNLVLAANSGCDTLLTLTVTETNPSALLANLPSNIVVSCNTPSVNLCADASPGTVFQWSKDGIPATQTPCLLATAGGVYSVAVTLDGCAASKIIDSEEHLVGPTLSAGGVVGYVADCFTIDSTATTFTANTNAIGPHFTWLLNGQIVSTEQSFTLYLDYPDTSFTNVWVTVADQFGCDNTKHASYIGTFPPMPPFIKFWDTSPDLCNGLQVVEFYIWGGTQNYVVTWNGMPSTGNKISLPPSVYDVIITDQQGCSAQQQIGISELFYVNIWDSPWPDFPTGSIDIHESSWGMAFLWDDGSTSSYRNSLAPGEYCVTMTDMFNCSIDTCFVVNGPVATNESISAPLRLSPNPATPGDWLDIALPENFSGTEILLELMDGQGKKVIVEKMENPTASLRFRLPETLPSGIFFLRASSEGSQATGKVLLKK
ncbi:MAG: hypothetical protein ACKVUS_09780 [Saprospiraceae bacterium]